MTILVTGGTGFIGRHLIPKLKEYDPKIIVLTRNFKKAKQLWGDKIDLISDLKKIPSNLKLTGIVNLAGAPIDKRWSKAYQRKLLQSRIHVTEACVSFIKRLDEKPAWFISGSAIGYYGAQGNDPLTEQSDPHQDFLHVLCKAWEEKALEAKKMGVRVCLSRTGVVLGKGGGALSRLRPLFSLGFGGFLGSGKQWFSWIHREDMVRALIFLMQSPDLEGPFNLTSPNPVTNLDFTKTFGKVLKRPTYLSIPSWLIRLLFGKMGDLLLIKGQRVIPKKLLEAGFEFKYPLLEEALINP